MRNFKLIAAAAVLLTATETCTANTLVDVAGSVSVNRGAGFMPANAGPLLPGDRIMVAPGSTAKVMHAGGCGTPIQPGFVYIVPASVDCGLQTSATEASPPPPTLNPLLITAGLGAVVVAGAAIYATQRREVTSRPASP